MTRNPLFGVPCDLPYVLSKGAGARVVSRTVSRMVSRSLWSPVWSLPDDEFSERKKLFRVFCSQRLIRFGRQHYQHSSKTDAGDMCAESDVPRTPKGLQLGLNHWLRSHCRSEHGPVEPTTGMAIRSLPHGIPCGRWAVHRIRNPLSGLPCGLPTGPPYN